MSRDEREAFLADVHVGVFGVADPRGDRAPLLVPVWYAYEPGGGITVFTGRESVKADLVRAAGRISLCVQDETAPYRYVSVEGPAVIEDRVDPGERAAMAHRYLDPVTAPAYLEANSHQLEGDVTVRMRPERWRTADFNAFAKEFS
ncbi:pyridoxamine 5'-phosphate oxidase family protein [Nocardiopsis sediminis]|uniref:Pyridoxamine 5'-phosphate oxidase family protein n=1 Tax=Nocardiopsis sediminis TaxID=1778267 RepID=A0ABV8FFC3_9ACTN